MKLNHLHLPVKNAQETEDFYARWFGFQREKRVGALTFLRNPENFLLIIETLEDATPLPLPFHVGFELDSPAAVEAAYDSQSAAGVPMARPFSVTDTLVSFRCEDPTGHVIEVYFLPS